jgi:hypothetical protein
MKAQQCTPPRLFCRFPRLPNLFLVLAAIFSMVRT